MMLFSISLCVSDTILTQCCNFNFHFTRINVYCCYRKWMTLVYTAITWCVVYESNWYRSLLQFTSWVCLTYLLSVNFLLGVYYDGYSEHWGHMSFIVSNITCICIKNPHKLNKRKVFLVIFICRDTVGHFSFCLSLSLRPNDSALVSTVLASASSWRQKTGESASR